MKRLVKIFSWLIIGLWCILIAIWTYYNFVYQENITHIKSTDYLNADIARESIVRIENEVGTIWYGTGFFITPNKIVTNIHVIAQPGSIIVQTIHEEKELVWEYLENGNKHGNYYHKVTNWVVEGISAFDVKNDLAILKVAGNGKPFRLGNSNKVKFDKPITIIGYPSKKFRVKKGYVYSVRKSDKWLRSDIVIGGGSSGSPVLNSKGQVLGVNSYIQFDAGYSLASPSYALKRLLKRSDESEPLEKWHNRDEIRSYAHYIKGQNRYNEKEYHQAIVELDKAIQLDPNSIYSYTKRGEAKSRLADTTKRLGNTEKARILYEAAIQDYNDAIKINSKNADAFSGRANAKFELGFRIDAIKDYNRAIEINSKHEILFSTQGNKKIEQGDTEAIQGNADIAQHLYEDAIDFYGYAINRNPKTPSLFLMRARANNKLGKLKSDQSDVVDVRSFFHNAINDCDHALFLNPDSASAYDGRALANYYFGDFEVNQKNISSAVELFRAAIEDWSHYIELIPEDPFKESILSKTLRNRGSTKIQLGKIETKRGENGKAKVLFLDALEDYKQAIQFSPMDTYAYSDRGWAYYLLAKSEATMGNIEKAIRLYDAAILDCEEASRIDPKNAYAFHNRGVTRSALGDVNNAIIDFDRAIQINPRYASAFYERGIAKETLGHKEQAKVDFDKAKELDPNIGN